MIVLLGPDPASAKSADALRTATEFMDAYAAGNRAKVVSMLSSRELHFYGSDRAEAASGRAAFEALFDADQKLWAGSASFGAITNLSSVRSGSIETLFFDRVFRVKGRQVPVRFAMVWRLENGAWRLVQSSNVVPTTGQSASEILKKAG